MIIFSFGSSYSGVNFADCFPGRLFEDPKEGKAQTKACVSQATHTHRARFSKCSACLYRLGGMQLKTFQHIRMNGFPSIHTRLCSNPEDVIFETKR